MSGDFEPILTDAIAKVSDGSLVMKWVVIAEVASADGERTLERFTSEAMTSWDVLGMLTFHAEFEKRRIQTPPDDEL